MKRLRRYIFKALTVLSLVLCVATVGLWVRSYTVLDVIVHVHSWLTTSGYRLERHASGINLSSVRGRLLATTDQSFEKDVPYKEWRIYDPVWKLWQLGPNGAAPHVATRWQRLGLYVEHLTYREPVSGCVTYSFSIGIPHWLLVLLSSVLPFLQLTSLFRRSCYWESALCQTCGYDLRATPDRCPECGTVPKKRTA